MPYTVIFYLLIEFVCYCWLCLWLVCHVLVYLVRWASVRGHQLMTDTQAGVDVWKWLPLLYIALSHHCSARPTGSELSRWQEVKSLSIALSQSVMRHWTWPPVWSTTSEKVRALWEQVPGKPSGLLWKGKNSTLKCTGPKTKHPIKARFAPVASTRILTHTHTREGHRNLCFAFYFTCYLM